MDYYINYLVSKYFIYNGDNGDKLQEIDKKEIKMLIKDTRVVSDTDFIGITKRIFVNFWCFDIAVEIDLNKRILEDKAKDIFFHYKKYKCFGVRETETYLRLDNNLNTSKTKWVESVDIKTSDLVAKFGEYIKTGKDEDNFRFEYKFEFIDNGKKWIFSLYDYLNTEDEFDDIDEIYWHVASNTTKTEVIKRFVSELYVMDCC